MAAGAAAAGSAMFELDEAMVSMFDTQCARTEDQLAVVHERTEVIKAATDAVHEAVDPDKDAALRKRVAAAVAESHKALATAKTILAGMKRRATEMEAKGGPSQMTARVCLPRYRALLQRFMKATTENQQAKMAFKGASVDRLAQQARMMRQFDGQSDDDLREELERDPDLITKTVQRMAHGEVMAEYAMAQQKEQDVRELMRDIEEIATMAKEISELVEAQSEVVDKIVSNIDITHDYVQRGEKSLERGLEAMRAARRRMCCLIIIVVVILVIISGVLGGVLGGA